MRKYDDPGAPPFQVLGEGENTPLDAYDNFVIGPKYAPAPQRKRVEGAPGARMAGALKAKGYEYQYLFCRGAGHGVGNARQQFLPHAIEWVWKGYPAEKVK